VELVWKRPQTRKTDLRFFRFSGKIPHSCGRKWEGVHSRKSRNWTFVCFLFGTAKSFDKKVNALQTISCVFVILVLSTCLHFWCCVASRFLLLLLCCWCCFSWFCYLSGDKSKTAKTTCNQQQCDNNRKQTSCKHLNSQQKKPPPP